MRDVEGRRWAGALGALVGLALLVVGVPWVLTRAATHRFGSALPWSGISPPWRWRPDAIADLLRGRLSDAMLADLAIRLSIGVIWVATVLVVFTVLAEVVHRVRHDGIGLPAVRGLGWSQSIARWMATGLLVVIPHVAATRVAASPPGFTASRSAVTVPWDMPFDAPWDEGRDVADADDDLLRGSSYRSSERGGRYLVGSGDSILAIAQRLAPGDQESALRLADEILELNLGTVMPDGQRFTNAALLEDGWVLRLPPDAPSPAFLRRTPGDEPVGEGPARHGSVDVVVHRVAAGETLWSIARNHLDDPARWPEIWERNAGTEMPDGRIFDDPDLILAGWELDVAVGGSAQVAAEVPDAVGEPMVVEDPVAVADGPGRQIVWDGGPPPVIGAIEAPMRIDVPTDAVPTDAVPTGPTSPSDTPLELAPPADTGQSVAPPDEPPGGSSQWATHTSDRGGWIGPGRALMLSVGVLSLIAVRRRRLLRQTAAVVRLAPPAAGAAEVERALRTHDPGHGLVRIDLALRAAADVLADRESVVTVALVGADGAVEVWLSTPVTLPTPWVGAGRQWTLPGSVPIDRLAVTGRSVGAPSVALVQLGVTTDRRDLYADLESLGSLAVVASPDRSRSVVHGLAATLGSSAFAEVAHLVGVGLATSAFLGHRSVIECASVTEARAMVDQLVVRVDARSTFARRARAAAGEAWEPGVILIDPSVSCDDASVEPSHGLAMVIGADAPGAGARLVDGGERWTLEGPGLGGSGESIELTPIGLDSDDLAGLVTLVEHSGTLVPSGLDDVVTTTGSTPAPPADADAALAPPAWSLLVRLLGPVAVTDAGGNPARFDRSKSLELITWLATHRQRSTRSAARTALWELDVRDATFANVVSDARRTMARLVPPPDGSEWLARTLTEDLPLHAAVATDAHLLEIALTAVRSDPGTATIQRLDEALSLVRGLPFEGTSYLWPDAEGITSNLVILATSAAIESATYHLECGQVADVFRATAAGLLVLPGHEELIALRMRAHAHCGDRAGVRQEWESYQRVIISDPWSDGEPAPKLVALRSELLSTPA